MANESTESFGPYLLQELLASGEAADVWSAVREGAATPVIIKRLLPPWTRTLALQKTFLEVVKDIIAVRHDNIVSLLDFGQDGEVLYVVFEKVEGVFLRSLIRARQPLEAAQFSAIASGLLNGLALLHRSQNQFTGRQLVHGDVSPGNVMIDASGRPRIADIGFSRVVLEAGLPGKPAVLDKRYIAPEVLAGGVLSTRSDVFGAGMILNDLAELVSAEGISCFAEVRQRASAALPAGRYPDAQAMLEDLSLHLPGRKTVQGSALASRVDIWAHAEQPPAISSPAGPVEYLQKRYAVIAELGSGAMGIVYHARDRSLDEELAIKVLRADLFGKSLDVQRFTRELKLARQVNHPNVARVFHLDQGPGFIYYTMEYVPGVNLEACFRSKGALSIAEAAAVFRQLAGGLAAIHAQHVIHRDIKPANVMLQESGRAVILDFGIARHEDEDLHITKPGAAPGTPEYMAPEQMTGGKVDYRADLFALGVMMYEALTGKCPFEGNTQVALYFAKSSREFRPLREVNPEIPRAAAELIESLLAPDPAERPQSAADIAQRLAGC